MLNVSYILTDYSDSHLVKIYLIQQGMKDTRAEFYWLNFSEHIHSAVFTEH